MNKRPVSSYCYLSCCVLLETVIHLGVALLTEFLNYAVKFSCQRVVESSRPDA